MQSTADLKTSLQVLNILNDQQPQEAPSDHTVPSSSSSTTFLGAARDVSFGLSVFSSRKQNMEERLPDSISTIHTSCRPTRHQRQQYLSQLSKDDPRKNHSENINERQRKGAPILSKRHELRTKKEKERSKPRLEYVEKARVTKSSKTETTRQGVDYTNTVMIDSRYQEESPNQSTLGLGRAERFSSRFIEDGSQHTCSTDTSGVGFPSIFDSQATIIPQRISLPTPPQSDTGSDYISRSKGVENNKPDGDPSYRFLPVPQRPPENTVPSITRSHFLPEPHSIQGTSPQARKKPLLNLIWRDMGNGIIRAYPRHYLPPPPPLSLEPPAALSTLIEGLGYFLESDGETTMIQSSPDEDTGTDNPTEDEDWLIFDDHDLQILSDPPTRHRESVNVFSSDSETDTNTVLPTLFSRAGSLPTYSFIAAPQITTIHPDCTPDADDVNTTLDPRTRANHDPDDEISSNVQPTHLTPYRVVLPLGGTPQSIEIDQYNPSTSSGFSDTEPETQQNSLSQIRRGKSSATTHAHKKCMRKRIRRHKTRRQIAATTTSTCAETHDFTRVAVLRAAERLTGLLDRKSF